MRTRIEAIRKSILTNPIFVYGDHLFSGAGLIVSPTPVDVEEGITVVVTTHARALSTLIFQLQDACSDWLDYLNKFDFFAALGKAANDFPPVFSDLRALLIHVVDAALEMETIHNRFLYFAYGSNMDEEQMANRCPDAEVVDVITVPGWRFALDTAGVATIVPEETSAIEGVLWSVTPEDIRNLDRYEGVSSGCYRKEYIPVDEYADGQAALVYLSNRDLLPRDHREGYMARILQAAFDHGFTREYIRTLAGFLPD